MTQWFENVGELAHIDKPAADRLAGLKPAHFPAGTVIFRPGDDTEWFPVVLSGRVDVYLTGRTGRDILLYSVTPGETCVQTTLGLLGAHAYTGEGIAASDVDAVIIPRAVFEQLVATSEGFRKHVFSALAGRLSAVVELLERVAFISVEERLASILLERAGGDAVVRNTHQDLATAIGSAREVVSRRLEKLARQGLISQDRGEVHILDKAGLRAIASESG